MERTDGHCLRRCCRSESSAHQRTSCAARCARSWRARGDCGAGYDVTAIRSGRGRRPSWPQSARHAQHWERCWRDDGHSSATTGSDWWASSALARTCALVRLSQSMCSAMRVQSRVMDMRLPVDRDYIATDHSLGESWPGQDVRLLKQTTLRVQRRALTAADPLDSRPPRSAPTDSHASAASTACTTPPSLQQAQWVTGGGVGTVIDV